MRHIVRWVVLPWLVVVAARAQAPAADAGNAPIWSPRAACALAAMQEWAADNEARLEARLPVPANGFRPQAFAYCGYAMTFMHSRGHNARPTGQMSVGESQRWGVYAFPQEGGVAEPVFFLALGSPLLWSANRTTRYRGGNMPAPDAALAGGEDRTWAALQRVAGIGQDGELWQLADAIPTTALTVVVRDADGKAVPGAFVRFEPAMSGQLLRRLLGGKPPGKGLPPPSLPVPLTAPVPAGTTTVGADGRGTVRGAPVLGLGLRVLLGGLELQVEPVRTAVRGDTLEVCVHLPSAKHHAAAEALAVELLEHISAGQCQCQASGVIDADGDRTGEYGFLAELAGATAVRSDANGGAAGQRITPPILSSTCAKLQQARVSRSGYLVQVFLHDRQGRWVGEHATGGGGRGVAVDPDRAEQAWCALAWPARAGWTGQRAFFIDHHGEVLAHANADGAWSGAAAPVPWTGPQPPAGWAMPARPAPPRGR